MRRAPELPSYIQAAAAIDLKIGNAATGRNIRHLKELDAPESLGARRLDLPPVEGLKVVQVAQLTRLTDAFTAGEALVAKEPQTVINVVEVAHEEQECADRCSCAALARIAVHNDHVLRILCLNKFNT